MPTSTQARPSTGARTVRDRGACSRRSTSTAATAAASRMPSASAAFVPAVIDAIGMRAHGPLLLERFGDDELEGWSAMQFIETSSITIHADEVGAVASSTSSPAGRSTRRSRQRSPSRTSAARPRSRCSSDDRHRPRARCAGGSHRRRRHGSVPPRHCTRKHAAAPRDLAHLGRAGGRRLPVPTGRRGILEPDHGRRAGCPDERDLPARDPSRRGRREPGRARP